MIIDSDGTFLTREQILELAQTKEGKRRIFNYLARARSAMTAQKIMERLGITPDEATQQDICLIVFDTNYRLPVTQVMDYIDSMVEHVAREVVHEC
jgi:hypothetical protein